MTTTITVPVTIISSPSVVTVADPCEEDEWWKTEGIEDEDVVAAYQPKGAANYLNSLINLAIPGTHDAFDDGGSNIPYWSAENGWTGDDNRYLRSDIVPPEEQTWSLLVRYSNLTEDYVCGSLNSDGGIEQIYVSKSGMSGELINVSNGYSGLGTSGDSSGGTRGFAGNHPCIDGEVIEASELPPGTTYAIEINPLGANTDGNPVSSPHVSIMAEVWYNKILTPTQVAAITANMEAL